MYKKPNIAIIEDNEDLRDELKFFLGANGYRVWESSSAELFWRQLHAEPTDIVLIDVGLPGEDGYGIVQHLSKLGRYGLIMLTARGSQNDKLLGLQSGADLYLIKPINFSKLIEQINVLWQRLLANNVMSSNDLSETSGDLKIESDFQLDRANYQVNIVGQSAIALTPIEFSLMSKLLENQGLVQSKQDLCDYLWMDDKEVELHRVDVVLSRLRAKFRSHGVKLPIRSIFGKGIVYKPKR
ncbi:MAG: response regulator transcription factor [Gammaproteobacteria bacterium]|uniref:response regulator transcription factor n=1 Tax=Marinomonas sp. BSi20584 TaxID=1594462 RepID=UPI000C1F533E|nr:response regulator transcription factor [Marinomonas sp. BSi20584]MBU1295818.1 response regulator transcription factor [Gammaproteobacteria bacterium]MBU1468659.1 response regulator transcription factor [Gammaproteobacteria bacterium]MBU2021953.1 response regulator transcription factor [Gammaproteobacteria bacterium]MBU2237822.1 response regulator transcription factor [Gammaproteobacteria bacterium]MBU2320364.1 response regulator transcription factor [Gammaproteobacteria bacterium]